MTTENKNAKTNSTPAASPLTVKEAAPLALVKIIGGTTFIFYGNVVLPFVDRFPTNTELYRVMTTKPEEVADSGK